MAKVLRSILEQHICTAAILNADEFRAYQAFSPLLKKHDIVTHGTGEYVRSKAATNTVVNSFCFARRGR